MGDVDKGHITTSRMGVQDLTDTLLTLVEWTEPEDHVAEALSLGVAQFHKLRVKRNSIIHGFNFEADTKSGKLFIERRTKSIVFDSFEEYEFTPATLVTLCGEQKSLSTYLYRIKRALRKRGEYSIGPDRPPPASPTPLPPVPPEPETLIPLPREAPKSKRRQRQALQVLEARQSKSAKKGPPARAGEETEGLAGAPACP